MNRIRFRQIKESDIDDIYHLALEAHAGITSLPKKRTLLEEKIERAVSQTGDLYFFGLDDQEQNKLIGVSAIKTNTQSEYPFNHYKITQDERVYPENLSTLTRKTRLLVPEKVPYPFSELSTLFLTRKERRHGLGRLLSLSRFIFIKLHRSYFNDVLKASLRGFFDENGLSPFWEHVGRKFVDMPYEQFTDIVRNDPHCLASVIPTTYPTLELLHPEAQKTIGLTHKNTVAAKHLLEQQGLSYDQEIDLLDGGPIISGPIDALKPLLSCESAVVSEIRSFDSKPNTIIAKSLPFQSALGYSLTNSKGLVIDEQTAKNLSLEIGNQVYYLKFEGSV